MGLSILFASLYSFHTMILFALILGVYLLKTIVNDFALPKVTYQKRKNILSVALFIVNLIVLGLLVYKSDQLSSLKFSTYDGEVSSYSNFYVNSLEINPDNLSNNNQLYYECRNDEVAQTLFEYVIIETERQKRISDDETIGLSFGEALARYQKYDSKVFEDCYRIGNFIVARNGNIVVRIVVEDVDKIDYVLESYLNF